MVLRISWEAGPSLRHGCISASLDGQSENLTWSGERHTFDWLLATSHRTDGGMHSKDDTLEKHSRLYRPQALPLRIKLD